MIYGAGYLFWAIYGTSFDVPAVLLKLVGLGYEVGRAAYREGGVKLEPLPGGYAARRDYEEGAVYILADLNRWALGVYAERADLLSRGVADLSRAYMELSIPEPPRAELHISFGLAASDCRSEKVAIGGVEFEKTGLVLRHGDIEGGDGVYISITPTGAGRYLFYMLAGGKWGHVVKYMRDAGDLVREVVAYFTCRSHL